MKITGYTTSKNIVSMDYPAKESIESMLGFCDDVVVMDSSDKDDGTIDILESLETKFGHDRVRLFHTDVDWTAPNHGIYDGITKALARKQCVDADYLWQFDCVPAGTKIMTNCGEIDIEKIKIGDSVLSHTGQFRKVKRTFERPKAVYPTYTIKKMSDNRPLTLTPNHPIYVHKLNEYRWQKLEDAMLTNKDNFIFPKLSTTVDNNDVEITINHGKNKKELKKVPLSKELGFFIGLYLGDGHVAYDHNKPQYVIFSLSEYQTDIIQRIRKICSDYFNIDVSVYHEKGKRAWKVQIGNMGLANWVLDLCNTGSYDKQLKEVIYSWPKEAIHGLLEGYYQSDGSVDKKYIKLDSVNGRLLSQVKLLLTRIDVLATFSKLVFKNSANGYKLRNGCFCYRLMISGKQLNKLPWAAKEDNTLHSRQMFTETKDAFLIPVNKFGAIIQGTYDGKLYNLEVEKDNSYIANGIVVHNCDEVVHEDDIPKIHNLISDVEPKKNLTGFPKIIALPLSEYWGHTLENNVRIDINPWKWRLSQNDPDITHGIPKNLQQFVGGLLYAKPGTDSCDPIYKSSSEPVPFLNFATKESDHARQIALTNKEVAKQYEDWFKNIVGAMPQIHHYSWWSVERKILQYKKFWTTFWKALYNLDRDERDNAFFPGKLWSEVTDEMIHDKAKELEVGTCGFIAHSAWNGTCNNGINLGITHPKIMKEWLEAHK